MNKAFVREPEFDGRAFCPHCGALGVPVFAPTLDTHIQEDARTRLGDSAWFCSFARCEVGYFDLFETVVAVDQLTGPVHPKDPDAPLCACFGFTSEDVEADAGDTAPRRIRELLKKSQSEDARCQARAADGQCCLREVQRLYMKMRGESST